MIVGLAILPHGTMVLDPSGWHIDSPITADPKKQVLPKGVSELHAGCVKVGELVASWKPDLIVLVTPHGISLSESYGIYTNSRAEGNALWNDRWQGYSVTTPLAPDVAAILMDSFEGIAPVEGITSFANMDAPLRWGEVVPLWFLHPEENTKALIISPPSRGGGSSADRAREAKARIPTNLAFGSALAKLFSAEGGHPALGLRVALVISGDLAHVHPVTEHVDEIFLPDKRWDRPVDGESARRYDSAIERWANGEGRDALLVDAAGAVSTALSCGFDGFVMMQGAIDYLESEDAHLLDYSVCAAAAPTYFGMLASVVHVLPARERGWTWIDDGDVR